MSVLRSRPFLPAVLALVLFLGWLGVGAAHHHADQPGCEICKAMNHGAADLPGLTAATAPRLALDGIPAAVHGHALEADPSLHPGRAPPLL